MSDPNLDKLTMGAESIGGSSSPIGTGKISPVNIPPPVKEEDITSPAEDEDDIPVPVLRPLLSRIVNDDDDEEEEEHGPGSTLDVEFLKRVLLGKDITRPKNQRTYSCEQSSGPHLWANPSRAVRMNPRKRTSAPQFGRTNTIKNTIVLRSRRSWPVAPPRIRRFVELLNQFFVIIPLIFKHNQTDSATLNTFKSTVRGVVFRFS